MRAGNGTEVRIANLGVWKCGEWVTKLLDSLGIGA